MSKVVITSAGGHLGEEEAASTAAAAGTYSGLDAARRGDQGIRIYAYE
jgi:hypothetical protein